MLGKTSALKDLNLSRKGMTKDSVTIQGAKRLYTLGFYIEGNDQK